VTQAPLPIDGLDDLANANTLAGRLFWNAPLPSLIVDGAGTMVHANAQLEAMFGWSRADLVGQSIELLVPAGYRAHHVADREAYAHAPPTRPRPMGRTGEITGVRRDGTELVLESQISQLETRGGRFFMAVLRDVTARRREAEHLARTNAELRESTLAYAKLDREKNALLGMVAHDLRTPLSVIGGYAELLTTLAPTEPLADHKKIVDVIEHAAKMMRRIVDDLLDWSAIEAGTLRLARRAVDPMNVAADAVALAGLAAARQGIALSLDQDSELPPIELDPGRISQVLTNLLGNALKYSRSGHPVRVHVGRSGDDALEFTVTDRGQGIEREELANIFRPFETTANLPVGGERATGLGLAIVKRIVDAHGGTITVESEPGVGSTFRVKLPLHAPPGTSEALAVVGQ
jgi:protein-histidine pros-kinase